MKNAWRTLAAVGLVTSFAIMGGCVVGSGDDENTGGSGGSTGGTGGTTGDGTVEIQGEHRERLREALQQRGFTVKG